MTIKLPNAISNVIDLNYFSITQKALHISGLGPDTNTKPNFVRYFEFNYIHFAVENDPYKKFLKPKKL